MLKPAGGLLNPIGPLRAPPTPLATRSSPSPTRPPETIGSSSNRTRIIPDRSARRFPGVRRHPARTGVPSSSRRIGTTGGCPRQPDVRCPDRGPLPRERHRHHPDERPRLRALRSPSGPIPVAGRGGGAAAARRAVRPRHGPGRPGSGPPWKPASSQYHCAAGIDRGRGEAT